RRRQAASSSGLGSRMSKALAVERVRALPLGQMPRIVVPFARLELDVGVDELVAELAAEKLGTFGDTERVEQVERQFLGAGRRLVAFGIHVDVEGLAGIGTPRDAVEARREHRGREQVRIGGAVGEPELETSATRNADHVRTVVA